MKHFKKIIICLLCILTVSGILFNVFSIEEVEASTYYGYVSVGDKTATGITVTGLGSNINVWELSVGGKHAFCARHGVVVQTGVKYTRYSLSSKVSSTSAQNIILKVLNWYSGTGDTYYTAGQALIWGALDGTITTLNSSNSTTYDFLETVMASIYGDRWSGLKKQWQINATQMNTEPDMVKYFLDSINGTSITNSNAYYYSYGSAQPVVTLFSGTVETEEPEEPDEPEYPSPKKETVNKTVEASEKVTVTLTKTDNDNGKTLEGVTFDVICEGKSKRTGLKTDASGKISASYTYSYSATSDNFTYCTNYSELSDTDKKNCPYSSKANAEEAALAQAQERLNAKLNKGHTCQAVETSTRTKYFFDSNNLKANGSVAGSGTISLTLKNKRQTGSITIVKKDADTDKALSGVVYGLYAAEDISHPDGKTGTVYKKDQLINTFPATNSNGTATLSNLYLAKYYVKEITALDGYQLDTTKRSVEISSTDSTKAVITVTKLLTNSKALIVLKKVDKDGKGLEGAEFELYAKEDIKKTDGTVAFKKDALVDKFVATDKDGKTSLSGLIAGSYYVIESKAPNGYKKSSEKVEFTISSTGEVKFGEEVITLKDFNDGKAIVIKNKLTKIIISKQDMATSKELPGATITICQTYVDANGKVQLLVDEKTNNCVEAVLLDGTKLTWVSTNKPREIEGLPAGTYYLVERIAPTDYTMAESILFTLKEDGTLVDKDGKSLKDNKLVMYDEPIEKPKEEKIENVETGSLSTYIVFGIIGLVVALGAGSYYYLNRSNNKNK